MPWMRYGIILLQKHEHLILFLYCMRQKIPLWCTGNVFLFLCSCVPSRSALLPSVTVHSLHLNSVYRLYGWTCCCYFTSDLRHKSSAVFPLLEPILAPYQALHCFASLSSSCSCSLLKIKIGSGLFLNMAWPGAERPVFLKYVIFLVSLDMMICFVYAWMLSLVFLKLFGGKNMNHDSVEDASEPSKINLTQRPVASCQLKCRRPQLPRFQMNTNVFILSYTTKYVISGPLFFITQEKGKQII